MNKKFLVLSSLLFCLAFGIKYAAAQLPPQVPDTGTGNAPVLEKPANVVVVAQSGGDFTSIQEAIDSITPTADNPYLIEVMPGIYNEENITLKSFVHLQGAGRGMTTILAPAPSLTIIVINLNLLTDVVISDFTIQGGNKGISIDSSSSITITGNSFKGSIFGIANFSSSPTITDNIFTENRAHGIFNASSSSPLITGNTFAGNGFGISNSGSAISPAITGNTFTGNNAGVFNGPSSSPTVTGNTITGNVFGIRNQNITAATIAGNTITGNSDWGIFNTSSSPTITHNRITDNGGGTFADIFVSFDSVQNISFNVYDTISGTTGVGQFNVKSDGSPAPAP